METAIYDRHHAAHSLLSLPQLQNSIKRSPSTYLSEFSQQLDAFYAQAAIYSLSASTHSGGATDNSHAHAHAHKDFGNLLLFLSHVTYLYPESEGGKRFGEEVFRLLEKGRENMSGKLRQSLFKGMILLKNKGQIEQDKVLGLCLQLFDCQDKVIREEAFNFIINDIKNSNKFCQNIKVNNKFQSLVMQIIQEEFDASVVSNKAIKSLQILIELYKKRVLTDAKSVNIVAKGLEMKSPKMLRLSLAFFLGIDDQIDFLEKEELIQKESAKFENDKNETVDTAIKKSAKGKIHSRKTRSKLKQVTKQRKLLHRIKGKMLESQAPTPRFPAIELLNDPHDLAENLFKKLSAQNEIKAFQIKLLLMNLISRIVGFHKVILLPFFSFIRRYFKPHQEIVTQILSSFVQACHELIPSEIVEPNVKLIANNFVNDRTDAETMAVGLNVIREVLARVPLLTAEEDFADLVNDLIQYKSYKNAKNSKSVVMAARSLLNSVREINPSILDRKERGKFHDTSASDKIKGYGDENVVTSIPGIELLNEAMDENSSDNDNDRAKVLDQIKVLSNEDFAKIRRKQRDIETEKANHKSLARKRKKLEDAKYEKERQNSLLKRFKPGEKEHEDWMDEVESFTDDSEAASENGEETDDEDEVEEEVELKSEEEDSEESESEEDREVNGNVVSETTINRFVKRKKLRKENSGKSEDKVKSNRRLIGSTNLEKSKGKNYLMLKFSDKVKRKQNKSLKQQQNQVKQHIKNLKKRKKTMQKIGKRRRG